MTYRMTPSLRADRENLFGPKGPHPELRDWANWFELEGNTATSSENYKYTIARFVEATGKSPIDATPGELLDFLRALPVGSRRTRKAHLSSFFEFADLNDLIEKNPMVRVPRIKQPARKVIDTFEPWEQAALIPTDPGRMALMLYTGLRQGEARKLVAGDIDLHNERLIVREGKGGKGRIVEFGSVCAAHVADLLLMEGIGSDETIWFKRPGGGRIQRKNIGESTFRGWWDECIAEAGVPYRKPHTTRHTYATTMMRAGVRLERLQDLMGHESISTTKDLYGHLNSQDIRADVALFDKLLLETVEKPLESMA